MPLDAATLNVAFDKIGARLADPVTITVGGSAVFVLRRAIRRPANDCDLLALDPEASKEMLMSIADSVAKQLQLDEGWLNDAMSAWEDDDVIEMIGEIGTPVPQFPVGWDQRLEFYKVFGNLRVQCLSQRDALALKARTTQERGDREGTFEKDLSMLDEMLQEARPADESFVFAIDHLSGLDRHHGTNFSRMIVALQRLQEGLL